MSWSETTLPPTPPRRRLQFQIDGKPQGFVTQIGGRWRWKAYGPREGKQRRFVSGTSQQLTRALSQVEQYLQSYWGKLE